MPTGPGTPTIGTGYNPYRPMCFAPTRSGELIGVNGVDRGFRWDGMTSSVELLGMSAPDAAPTVTVTAGGAATAGDYDCAYRYIDDTLPLPIPSDLSDVETVTASANDKFVWAFSAPTESRAVYVELYRTTAGQSVTFYLLRTFKASGIPGAATNAGGFAKFTLGTGHTLLVGCTFAVTGHSEPTYNTTHTVTARDATTVTTDIAFASAGSGGTWTISGYNSDTRSDDQVAVLDALPLLADDDRTLVARRFGVPPNNKAVCAWFQDRMFYGVDVDYTQGSANVTNNSTTVTTTDGGWTSAMVGRYFYVSGESTPYLIGTVTPGSYPAASMGITPAYAGSTTGVTYAIRSSPSERNLLYFSEPDEPESVPATNTILMQENTGDNDEVVGMLPQGGYLMILKQRHIYRLSFVRQPTLDVNITLAASRGALSNRTAIYVEGVAYIMDYEGVYRWDGSNAEPLEAMSDLFRSGYVAFTYKEFFFCSHDTEKNIVRFHVVMVEGNVGAPMSGDENKSCAAICINYRSGATWLELTPFPLGSACLAYIANRSRPIVGSKGEQLYISGEGSLDGTNESVAGTPLHFGSVSAATSTTVSQNAGNFPSDCLNASIAIIAGTGRGQLRYITTRNSNTQVTVNTAWTTTPDTTSKFSIGAIELTYRTGLMQCVQKTEDGTLTPQSVGITYLPITDGNNLADGLAFRIYTNHSTTTATRSFGPLALMPGVTVVAGTSDVFVNMHSSRSSLATNSGYNEYNFASQYEGWTTGAVKWVAVELHGFQDQQQIEIYELTFDSLG